MTQKFHFWVYHIYPKKTITPILKDTCTPMFIGALFTIAKIWKIILFSRSRKGIENIVSDGNVPER